MTVRSARIAVLNSLLYLRDPSVWEPPTINGLRAVWRSEGCLAFSALPDCDGETLLSIGPAAEVVPEAYLVCDERLPTPSRRLIVETVLAEEVLGTDVPETTTRVRIWTNGYVDTDVVVIGWGD